LDAVEAAVRVLEDDPVFDAGVGSVLNSVGKIEMDAFIMNGATLQSGAIASVNNVKNPITLARRVMDSTPHCMIVGEGANAFAEEQDLAIPDSNILLTEESRIAYEQFKYEGAVDHFFNKPTHGHDTVGAVAFDCNGDLACGTSTGGITGKRPGRVGDSPLIGCGGYADNASGACSSTGHGESIMAVLLCQRAILMADAGMTPNEATQAALKYMFARTKGRGGLIMIDKSGAVGHFGSTERMAWASAEGVVGAPPTHTDANVDNAAGFNAIHE
jgi:L-asparaginase / beta-aspartyl-peptidase